MSAPHLRGGGFHVPFEVVSPILEACGIEVIDPTLLRARCPAEELHTTSTGPGDCVIFPNAGVPRIFCHHRSCAEQVGAINRRLWSCTRRNAVRASPSRSFSGYQQGMQRARHDARASLEQHAARILPHVLETYHWPVDAIQADSPTPITLPVAQHDRYIFDLFEGTEVVWTGERVNQTGLPWHAGRFRTVNHWSAQTRCPGVFICPATFVPGSYSRSDRNVAVRKFLVVESDTLGRNEVGAVFRMMRDEIGVHLRAVVDTGRRSLHAWFNMPAPSLLAGLEVILRGLGCEPAMFRPSQPCRLPGAIRPETGRCQELLYLDLAPAPANGTSFRKAPLFSVPTP